MRCWMVPVLHLDSSLLHLPPLQHLVHLPLPPLQHLVHLPLPPLQHLVHLIEGPAEVLPPVLVISLEFVLCAIAQSRLARRSMAIFNHLVDSIGQRFRIDVDDYLCFSQRWHFCCVIYSMTEH